MDISKWCYLNNHKDCARLLRDLDCVCPCHGKKKEKDMWFTMREIFRSLVIEANPALTTDQVEHLVNKYMTAPGVDL